MFEATLEAQALQTGERRIRSLSVAVLAHAGVLAAIVTVTAMIVPDVRGPEPPSIIMVSRFDSNILRALGPQDSPPPIRQSPPPTGARPIAPVVPRPIETPTETPDRVVEALPVEDPGTGVPGEGGESDGVEKGIPGATGQGGGGGGEGDGPGLDDGPQPLTGDMVRPVLISKVEPVYPKSARIARLEGRVVLEAVVGLDGRVESVEVVSSSNGMFDEAAQTAVRKWVYTPAKMNGSPVRIYFTVQVSFTLR